MKTVGLIAVGCSLLLPVAAMATGIKPGAWKITINTTHDGKPVSITKNRCITPSEASDPEADFRKNSPDQNGTDCNSQHSWNGTMLTWHVKCTGKAPIDSQGAFTYDTPTHMTGTITSQYMNHPKHDVSIEGSLVGDCTGFEAPTP